MVAVQKSSYGIERQIQHLPWIYACETDSPVPVLTNSTILTEFFRMRNVTAFPKNELINVPRDIWIFIENIFGCFILRFITSSEIVPFSFNNTIMECMCWMMALVGWSECEMRRNENNNNQNNNINRIDISMHTAHTSYSKSFRHMRAEWLGLFSN